jgi:hypothetical protein
VPLAAAAPHFLFLSGKVISLIIPGFISYRRIEVPALSSNRVSTGEDHAGAMLAWGLLVLETLSSGTQTLRWTPNTMAD